MTDPNAAPSTAPLWIDRVDRLAEVVSAIAAVDEIAVDGEGNSMYAYRERVCLVQINAGGRIFLLDCLALAGAGDGPWSGLEPLRQLLADPRRTVLLHGGEWDVGALRRDFGIEFGRIYDTQQGASMLGWEQTGYGAVVARTTGTVLAKGHAQYDWGRRPIDADALQYAADDVIHLPAAAAAVRAAVAEAGLDDEVAIACEAVRTTTRRDGFDPGGFWRIKDVRRLPPNNLPVLAALWLWRDGEARRRNRPPGMLLNNEALLALARQVPTSFQQLKTTLRGWALANLGEAVIACIRAARDQPGAVPPPVRHREVPPEEEEREKRMKDWRRAEAENRKVSLQAVLPAKALEYLKQHGAHDLDAVPQLGAKRIDHYGEKLRDLCR